jgi:hypothetical protein
MGFLEDILGSAGNYPGMDRSWYDRPVDQQNPLYTGMSQREMQYYAGQAAQSILSRPKTDYDLAMEDLNRDFPSLPISRELYIEPIWLRFLRWIVKVL